MNIKQAKNILLTELLARLNVFPAKISGDLAYPADQVHLV